MTTESSPTDPNGPPDALGDGWEICRPEDAGFDGARLAPSVQTVADDGHRDLHAVLIARHGRLAFEAYFNGHDATFLHDVRSAGKSFTSTLIGIAADQGLIDVDDPVLPYFDAYQPVGNPDPRKDAITIRHLLTMTSGLDADDDDPATPGSEETFLKADDWIRYGLDLPMAEAPGRRWVYAGINSLLLAGLVEQATNRPFANFAVDNLFDPLGIEAFLWQSSPAGTVAGQGFLSVRARDLLKLGQLVLDGGNWRGRRIVSDAWVQDATAFRIALPGQPDAGYGYQWWHITVKAGSSRHKCVFASGNGGNKVYVVPAFGLAVAITSSAYGRADAQARSHAILETVIGAAT